ncbi:MAG TPA: amino acid permease, partial [Acidobacteriota bacterium]
GLTSPVAVLLTLGGLGTLAAWIAGAARLPYSVGVDRYLPQVLGKLHPKWGTPYVSLLALGILSSIITLLSFQGASVKEAYLKLANACLILYFIPFVYLFLAYIWFNAKQTRSGIRFLLCVVGIISTLIAIVLACIPPADTDATDYIVQVIGGSFGFVLVAVILFLFAKRRMRGTA